MTRRPFPSVIDSSIIADFRSCATKFSLAHIEHWKSRGQSVHLHAGGAYAKGLEVARTRYYQDGASVSEAEGAGLSALLEAYGDYECPPDSAKSAERTAGALEFYCASYPFHKDRATPIDLPGGKKGIEFSFSEPIDATHPETGDPIIYAGRMDAIVSLDGMTFGLDDKTASQLGASWPKQWDLRSQFTGYCWGAQRSSIKLDGFLIRGVSILKTKYDTMEAVTYRPQWMIDRWYEQLLRDVATMKRSWESGQWDLNLDHACNEYSGCQFRDACLMREPQPLLDMRFERRRWDPITRQEILLEA